METRPSCIVIGAGLAGLAAAYRLAKARWKVTVLEAQKRFGVHRVAGALGPASPHVPPAGVDRPPLAGPAVQH